MDKLFAFLILFIVVGCKDKFDMSLKDTDKSLLVVEGTLRVGRDTTTITVSKTVNVNEKTNFKPILKARLTVEDKGGRSVQLTEAGNGKYSYFDLGLVPGNEYRLRIRTSDNKEFLSEYVVAKVTPTIDSISWKKENEDVFIYANAHDNTGNTRYYKWDFGETWEINSFYSANYQYLAPSTVVSSPSFHYRCWKYGKSTTINVGSSAHLSSDVISEFPILIINKGSEKLSVRYSILVRQESLSKKAYEYLLLMKKNTESLGSIFDPLPSDLKGNIQCISNPEEGVIGYLTASSVTQKRIFISQAETKWRYDQNCSEIVQVRNHPDSIKYYMPTVLPFAFTVTLDLKEYYLSAAPPCVDCVLRGGDLTMPSYW